MPVKSMEKDESLIWFVLFAAYTKNKNAPNIAPINAPYDSYFHGAF